MATTSARSLMYLTIAALAAGFLSACAAPGATRPELFVASAARDALTNALAQDARAKFTVERMNEDILQGYRAALATRC